MGRFSTNGMCDPELESVEGRRPHSPGIDEIGEILLPQDLVDEILKDVKVDVQIGDGDAVKDSVVDEIDVSDNKYYDLRDTTLEDVVGGDDEIRLGDIQVQESGFDTRRVVNDGGDHLDAVETIGMSSSDMNESKPEGVRNNSNKRRCISSEADLRKEKRKIANRVAAAKSHASKRAQLEMLESKLMNLRKENLLTEKSLQFVKGIREGSNIRFQLRRTSSL